MEPADADGGDTAAPDQDDTESLTDELADPGPDDAFADADGGDPGGWPLQPETCAWYELRSVLDDASEDAETWVRDAFLAPGPEPILRVVSVSRVVPGPGTPSTFTVRLRRTYRPVVLVLAAYESVNWVIEREPGAGLVHLYVHGYEAQTVEGASDVPLTNDSPFGDLLEHCYPFCAEGDGRAAMSLVEEEVGLPLTTFDGAYEAAGITLGDVCREECIESVACDGRACGYVSECGLECAACAAGERCDGWDCLPCSGSCDGRECGSDGCGGSCGVCGEGTACDTSGLCVRDTAVPACASVASESHFCATLSDGRPALLGLDSGAVCPFGKPELDLRSPGAGSRSIGWLGGSLFICVDRPGLHGLVRYSIFEDLMSIAPVPCQNVVPWRGGLVAQPISWMPPRGMLHFGSFEAAIEGDGEEWGWTVARSSAMAAGGDLLYWCSGCDDVNVTSLPSGEDVGSVTLASALSAVWGLSVTPDGWLVVSSGGDRRRVTVFDAATGAELREVVADGPVGPLACVVGP